MKLSSEQSGNFALVQHTSANNTPVVGGVAVAGFSTVGMVGVIAASHVIRTLDLQHVGSVLDKRFPAVALIHDHVPKHPAFTLVMALVCLLLRYNSRTSMTYNSQTLCSNGSLRVAIRPCSSLMVLSDKRLLRPPPTFSQLVQLRQPVNLSMKRGLIKSNKDSLPA